MILITRVANNEFIIGKYNEYFQLNKSKSEANPIKIIHRYKQAIHS